VKLDVDLLAKETIERQRVSGADMMRTTMFEMTHQLFKDKTFKVLMEHAESMPDHELKRVIWLEEAAEIAPSLKSIISRKENIKKFATYGLLLDANEKLVDPAFQDMEVSGSSWDKISGQVRSNVRKELLDLDICPRKIAETQSYQVSVESAKTFVRSAVYKTMHAFSLLPSPLSRLVEQMHADPEFMTPILGHVFPIANRVVELIDRDEIGPKG
jgi:hypothetical protein